MNFSLCISIPAHSPDYWLVWSCISTNVLDFGLVWLIGRFAHAAESGHIWVQREMRLQTEARVHETDRQTVWPVHSEYSRRDRSAHVVCEGESAAVPSARVLISHLEVNLLKFAVHCVFGSLLEKVKVDRFNHVIKQYTSLLPLSLAVGHRDVFFSQNSFHAAGEWSMANRPRYLACQKK